MVKAALDVIPDSACEEIFFFRDYWVALKGELSLPPCEKLDPLDFFNYLSRVFILEGRSIEELHVRLAGTVYRELYGFEVTGKKVIDLIPFDNRRDLMDSYAQCMRNQVPIFDVNKMTWRERGSEVFFERILLPFGDTRGVERVLGFAQFFDNNGNKIFT